MNARRFFLLTAAAATLTAGISLCSQGSAQEPSPAVADAIDRVHLFDSLDVADLDSLPSSLRQSPMSVSELRQARGMRRARQREARLESNMWMRDEPLRPNWNALPMMSSRYSNPRIYVPVYVWPSL